MTVNKWNLHSCRETCTFRLVFCKSCWLINERRRLWNREQPSSWSILLRYLHSSHWSNLVQNSKVVCIGGERKTFFIYFLLVFNKYDRQWRIFFVLYDGLNKAISSFQELRKIGWNVADGIIHLCFLFLFII